MLAQNCRFLKWDGEIRDTWTINSSLKFKLLCGTIKNISHDIDLYSQFPNYNKFTFDADFCSNALENEYRGNYDDRLTAVDDKWVRDVFMNSH